MCVVYSEQLRQTKTKTVEKQFLKEVLRIEKLVSRENKKKPYACLKDAETARKQFLKNLKKLPFHEVETTIEEIEVAGAGRPRKDGLTKPTTLKYQLIVSFKTKENIKEIQSEKINRECIFVLASNHIEISGEEMLRKYKGQSEVEIKFQQFKSRNFLNAIFLKRTDRIEVLMYLYLIALQTCSIVEYQVRKGLEDENESIREISTGLKMKSPTFRTIFENFRTITYETRKFRGIEKRYLIGKLTEDHEKILRYLGLEESNLIKE